MMIVLAPTVTEEGLPEAIERITGFVTTQGGEVQSALHENPWGRRRLAYQIDDHRDAFYVLYRFTAKPEVVTEIEREIKLDETVIRYLVVRYDVMTEHTERTPRERPDAPGGPGGLSSGTVPFRRTTANAPIAEAAALGAADDADSTESDATAEPNVASSPAEMAEPDTAAQEATQPEAASAERVEPTEPDTDAQEATTSGDTDALTETSDPSEATDVTDDENTPT